MPPKFGNYLFRNLKGQSDAGTANSPSLEEAAELADQTIVLRPQDFVDDDSGSGALNWPSLDPAEFRIQFRATNGLMEGRVVIAADILRRNHRLLPPPSLVVYLQFP